MDGVELARAIRRENPTQALAIYTACISPGPFIEALWQLRIPAADKLGPDQALLELVEEALTSNSERLAEYHPVTVQLKSFLGKYLMVFHRQRLRYPRYPTRDLQSRPQETQL